MQGYRFIGVAKEHIFKKGEFRDVALLELTAEKWQDQSHWHDVILDIETWIR